MKRRAMKLSFGPGHLTAWRLTAFALSRSVTLSAYNVTGQFPWSSLREKDRGVSAEVSVSFPSPRSVTGSTPEQERVLRWRRGR